MKDNETVEQLCDYLSNNGNSVGEPITVAMPSLAERIRAAHKREVAELRECLRIIRDNLLSYTIRSADGKYVNNGAFLSEEFVDDERWRKAIEVVRNEN